MIEIRPGQASDHQPAPVSYTPKHLADKILQSKSALEGQWHTCLVGKEFGVEGLVQRKRARLRKGAGR